MNNLSKVVVEGAKDKKLYDIALAALKDNRFEVAEEKFNNFITTYPKSSLQSNAYFWYGETFFRRNIFDKAAINYLKGYKQFPKGAKAADSLLKLALTLGELKKKTEACSILTKLETEFPDRLIKTEFGILLTNSSNLPIDKKFVIEIQSINNVRVDNTNIKSKCRRFSL